MDNALSEMEAQREAHAQRERDLQIQQQASEQAAEQIPSIRYVNNFMCCCLLSFWSPSQLLAGMMSKPLHMA